MSDSFADLWNISAPLPAKPKSHTLTLAARLAEEDNKRYRSTTATVGVQSHKAPDVSHEAWVGLDSLESGNAVKVDDVDDWGLKDFGSTATANPNPTSNSKTLWDLDDFSSSTQSTSALPSAASYQNSKPQSRPISRSASHHSSSQIHQQKVDSPDMDFDFGLREDQDQDLKSSNFLDDDDHDHLISNHEQGKGFDVHRVMRGGTVDEDEEDILGVLSRPVEDVIANKVFLFPFLCIRSFFLHRCDELNLICFFSRTLREC